MLQRGRRLARCRVDAAVPAWQRPWNLRILLAIMLPVRDAETISAIGVKCSAPAVEFVHRDAHSRSRLPSTQTGDMTMKDLRHSSQSEHLSIAEALTEALGNDEHAEEGELSFPVGCPGPKHQPETD
jgi:hypothetical protein